MPAPAGHIPKLCVHRGSGRAFVKLGGRQVYCGKAGTAAAQAEYDRLVRDWLASGRGREAGAAGRTVGEVVAAYEGFARGRYAAGRLRAILGVTGDLRAWYGGVPAGEFGPRRLREARAKWAGRMARRTANAYAGLARKVFRWAVQEEMVPPSAWEALRALAPLGRGEGGREKPGVGPAPEGDVGLVLAALPGPMADLARVQLLAGMRPGEACRMLAGEVDRSGETWVYRPGRHKKDWIAGAVREVALGPRARAILGPRLDACPGPESPAFRPPNRATPYSVASYRCAVRRACLRLGVPAFSPNQLRHNAATEIRRRFGLDAAAAALGHDDVSTTQVYAEKSRELAIRVAREIG